MILVDTSVWIDHLRKGEPVLIDLLQQGQTLTHPFVVGELALGSMRDRQVILSELLDLPQAVVASDEEVLRAIQNWELFGTGIGFVDVHLLAAATLGSGTRLWTRDRRLRAIADRLGFHANLG